MEKNDTITALATPRGRGALAVIRLSGKKSTEIFSNIIKQKQKFLDIEKNYISIYNIMDENNDIIDEVTAVKYLAPRSYTGEDMVEIYAHGGTTVVDIIIGMIIKTGARYAGKGEFTRRAFCNGKKTIASAEAIESIISSRDRKQLKSAVKSYMGGYLGKINEWKRKIEDILVRLETAIEFEEDNDIENDEKKVFLKELEEIRKDIEKEIERRKKVKKTNENTKIVTAGPQNAGKSSIVNLILGYDRVIVDSTRGTTRDFVTEQAEIHGKDVEIIDTAGICRNGSEVEKKGIERSWDYIECADMVLWVTASDEEFYEEERTLEKKAKGKILAVINKIDISNGKEKERYLKKKRIEYVKTDALKKNEREKMLEEIKKRTGETEIEESFISTDRQESVLRKAAEELKEIKKIKEGNEEIAAQYCRNILSLFDEFVGVKAPENIMDDVFSRFCIGK